MKTQIIIAAISCLLLVSCATPLVPGADQVQVVSSDAAVQGAQLVSSWSSTCGIMRVRDLNNVARNFAVQQGCNLVLLRTSPLGENMVTVSIEAWRMPQNNPVRNLQPVVSTAPEDQLDLERRNIRFMVEWYITNTNGGVFNGVSYSPQQVKIGEQTLATNFPTWLQWCDQHPSGGVFTDSVGHAISVPAEKIPEIQFELRGERDELESRFKDDSH